MENSSLFGGGELLQRLREWRRQQAAREGVELYRVFTNAVLEATAAAKPSSLEELRSVKGWGDSKISKYGAEVLGLLGGDPRAASDLSLPQAEPEEDAEERVFMVGEFIAAANAALRSLRLVKVRGELGEINRRAGFAFFTLKDTNREAAEATIQCFIGSRNLEYFSHLLEGGAEVIISGWPNIHRSGFFRLEVSAIEPVGEGAWLKALEALKKKLEAKGYFDQARKRPVPPLVRDIGLITSEAGAAVTDFKKNLGNYGFRIFLRDVRVEGDYAESSIVSAIRWFNQNRPELDLLVLIRGGGGAENLKTFNSEKIAEAIIASRLPLITGIGHEKDESIADLVADRSFSTPTAVAQFLTRQREEMLRGIEERGDVMLRRVEDVIGESKVQAQRQGERIAEAFQRALDRASFSISRLSSEMHRGLGRIFTRFDELARRFSDSFHRYERQTLLWKNVVASAAERTGNRIAVLLADENKRLEVLQAALSPLNPEAVLERGYSLAYTEAGKVVKDAGDVKIGDELKIRFSKGRAETKVTKIEK